MRAGGRFDTIGRAWVGEPETWTTWTVGAGQMPPLESTGRFVCVGAMGGGKTETLAGAAIVAALLSPGKAVGVVAPTQKRLRIAWQKITRLLLPAWVSEVRVSDGEIVLVNGCRMQFVAAKIYSKDVGSPIQGYSWVAAFVDEEQDIEDEAMADVMMRGRDAPGGIYPVLSTCTLKDTPSWRERKGKYEADPRVTMYRMEATANPFVAPEYWEILRSQLTPRQYAMRVLAMDARPEKAVYHQFSRERHVRAIPRIGMTAVTRRVTGGYGLLIGHDPGTIYDVSILLQAFEIHGEPGTIWFVVGELTTEETTSEAHAARLLELCQTEHRTQIMRKAGKEWVLDDTEPQAIIRADPYGNSESKPHVTVYKEFVKKSFAIKPAEYAKTGTGGGGSIPIEARVAMVNGLLGNAAGETRLFIASNDRGAPVAPRLVAALEMAARNEAGKADADKKTKSDVSHWPAALGYALWPYEKTRLSMTVTEQGAIY